MQEPLILRAGDLYTSDVRYPKDLLIYLGWLKLPEYTAFGHVNKPKFCNVYYRQNIEGHWFARLHGPVFVLERHSFADLTSVTEVDAADHALCGRPINDSGSGTASFTWRYQFDRTTPVLKDLRVKEADNMLLGRGRAHYYVKAGNYLGRDIYEEHRDVNTLDRYFNYGAGVICGSNEMPTGEVDRTGVGSEINGERHAHL